MSGATPAPDRPIHDRPTWITFIQLGTWAWFTYAFGATIALLRDEQQTTQTAAGLHGTAFAIGGLIAAILAPPAVTRWGRGQVLRYGALGCAAGILVYTAPGGVLAVTLAGAFAASCLGTLAIVGMNAFILDHQGLAGPAAFTEAQVIASLAGLIGPLAIGVGAATIFGWRIGLWVVVVSFVLVEVWRGRDTATYGTPGIEIHAEHGHRLPRRVYWSLGVIMCFLGVEFSLVFWSADLLRERSGLGPAAAAASLAAIIGGMLIGRMAGSRIPNATWTDPLLRVSVVFALVSFFIAWSFTAPAVVITGLFLTGVGIGVHWPLGVARTVFASDGMTDRATAGASFAGSIAIAIAPLALGMLSDRVGFRMAFLLVPALLVIALILLLARPVRVNEERALA